MHKTKWFSPELHHQQKPRYKLLINRIGTNEIHWVEQNPITVDPKIWAIIEQIEIKCLIPQYPIHPQTYGKKQKGGIVL